MKRNSVGNPPGMVICVGSVVSKDDQVLFIRQARGHALEGQWSIPWGIVDLTESPDAAAVRETHEEGGVHVEIEGLLGFQALQETGWIALVFLCRYVEGTPEHDGGIETDGAAFFSLNEMDAFNEPFEPWCDWIVRRVLSGNSHITPYIRDNPYRPKTAYF